MNKRGFTLMELLAVIALLTLMGLIVIPIVENSINSGKDDLYITQIDSVKASLKKYAIEEVNPRIRNSYDDDYLSLYLLKIAGFVSLDIKDPRTEKLLPDDMLLRIEKREKSYVYEVLETTGTKTNKEAFDSNTPTLEVDPVAYYCTVTGEVSESFNAILNDYTVSSGTPTKEYYDADFTKEIDLITALSSDKDFRVIYRVNDAYAIKNILRNGCE